MTTALLSSMTALRFSRTFWKVKLRSMNSPGVWFFRCHSRISQKIGEKSPHPLGSFGDEVDANGCLTFEFPGVAFEQELGEKSLSPEVAPVNHGWRQTRTG